MPKARCGQHNEGQAVHNRTAGLKIEAGPLGGEMADQIKEIVISKEDAVFWLDGKGRWHNADGPFRHKKIIDYFHTSIQKDSNGYFLCQERDNLREKFYFRHEDTALFVFDVIFGKKIELVLNTGRTIPLEHENLYVSNDCLYLQHADECIKFDERSLLKLSSCIEEDKDGYVLCADDKRLPIRTKSNVP